MQGFMRNIHFNSEIKIAFYSVTMLQKLTRCHFRYIFKRGKQQKTSHNIVSMICIIINNKKILHIVIKKENNNALFYPC